LTSNLVTITPPSIDDTYNEEFEDVVSDYEWDIRIHLKYNNFTFDEIEEAFTEALNKIKKEDNIGA
jgi:hypothetical protein